MGEFSRNRSSSCGMSHAPEIEISERILDEFSGFANKG